MSDEMWSIDEFGAYGSTNPFEGDFDHDKGMDLLSWGTDLVMEIIDRADDAGQGGGEPAGWSGGRPQGWGSSSPSTNELAQLEARLRREAAEREEARRVELERQRRRDAEKVWYKTPAAMVGAVVVGMATVGALVALAARPARAA